ncbi:MAG: DUF2271 domain-containing protein [Pseudomonadota bacterium]
MKSGQSWLIAAAGLVTAASIPAAELSIKVTLPEIASRGPRPPTRPYVAIWLRRDDNTFATNLAVWYQIVSRERRGPAPPPGGAGGPPFPGGGPMMDRGAQNAKTPGGARWLNEVRQWWADSGNSLQFPVDGVTSASRAAGVHELTFASNDPKLANLPPGKYRLMVEAAREHGGEETISIPFTLPATTLQNGRTSGKSELGGVELVVKP